MDEDEAKQAVEIVFDELQGRRGFDGWWGSLEVDTRREIRRRIEVRLVDKVK